MGCPCIGVVHVRAATSVGGVCCGYVGCALGHRSGGTPGQVGAAQGAVSRPHVSFVAAVRLEVGDGAG